MFTQYTYGTKQSKKFSCTREASVNSNLFLYQNRFGEIQHYMICSPMDPLQCMGAVRMRIQTAEKYIRIIHMTPVHQLMSCEMKSSMQKCEWCFDSHSDGTHSLQRIHWWASNLIQNCLDEEKTSSCMAWLWVHFHQVKYWIIRLVLFFYLYFPILSRICKVHIKKMLIILLCFDASSVFTDMRLVLGIPIRGLSF